MQLPATPQEWLEEIDAAYSAAQVLAQSEQGELTAAAKQDLYKFAAIFAAKNRAVTDRDTRVEAARFAAQSRAKDFNAEPAVVSNYEINFMLAYLESHMSMGVITATELDSIMRYLLEHFNFHS